MEAVNHPDHYNAHPSGVEAIDLCERLGFNLGNAVKCLMRADHKGRREEDLKKAAWYLRRESERCSRWISDDGNVELLAERIMDHEPAGTPLDELLSDIAQGHVTSDDMARVAALIELEVA